MRKLAFVLMLMFVQSVFAGEKILVVLSSENKISLQNGVSHPTGYFLSELAIPLMGLLQNGYEPVFATPLGNSPTMDRISDAPQWFGNDAGLWTKARQLAGSLPGLRKPWTLSDIRKQDLKAFAGIFIPGGHAPLEDLLIDKDLGFILSEFHRMGRPTGLICHGPIALLSALPDASGFTNSLKARRRPSLQNWIYQGYAMTSFSTMEEKQEEPGQDNALGGFVPFYPDLALHLAGGRLSVGPKWTSHVVRDRELITAQNPMSDKEFTSAFLGALAEQKRTPEEKRILSLAPQLKQRLVSAMNARALTPYDGRIQWDRVTSITSQPVSPNPGYSVFFIGARLDRLPVPAFAAALDHHLSLVANLMSPRGLRGYVVYATPDFEVAVMTWTSEADMTKAFAQTGSIVPDDAGRFLKTLIWEKL